MFRPADWIVSHPRLGAGLWFGSCLALGSLACLLLVGAISFAFFRAARVVPPVSVVTLGAFFLTAMGAGSFFGKRLITSNPGPMASDGYRIGAIVGLFSGLLSGAVGMLTSVWGFWRSAGSDGALSGIAMMIGVSIIRSLTYLPVGVLAGWSLVRLVSSPTRRPMKGAYR